MIKFLHTKELNDVQIFYILALIKRGGGMCPMKPGNRQGDFLGKVPIHTKFNHFGR